jgi:membrane-associated protease RseP (regulator of RpoE activity)
MRPDEAGANADAVACPSCHTMLVRGMRFCRMCGYRMGEGVQEFAETRRFDGQVPPVATSAPPKGAAGSPFQTPHAAPFHAPHAWGAMSPVQPVGVAAAGAPSGFVGKCVKKFNPMRLGWVFWIILSIVVLTAGAAAIRQANSGRGGGQGASMPAPRAFLGVDGFVAAPGGGGAMIEGIAAPDTPVERAGLIGGDIIVNFDGQAIADDDELRKVIAATPVGKAVEVVFIRDGATQKTTLTIGSEREYKGWEAIDARPGGKGQFGIDDYDRVRVPGREIYGVRVNGIDRNEPADLAGMQSGDIVIQIGESPVRTVGDLRYLIFKAVPGSIVKVIVVRGTEQVEIPVKVGRSN